MAGQPVDRDAAGRELAEALATVPAKLSLYGLVGLVRDPAVVADEIIRDLTCEDRSVRRLANRAVLLCCWPGMQPPAEWWRGALGEFVGHWQAAFVEGDLAAPRQSGEIEAGVAAAVTVTVAKQPAPQEPAAGWVVTFVLEGMFSSMLAGIAGPDGLLLTSPGWRALGLDRMWVGPTPTGTVVAMWVNDAEASECEPDRAVWLAGEGLWTLFDDGVFYEDPPTRPGPEALRWRQAPMLPQLRDTPQPGSATAKYWEPAGN